MLLLTAFFMVLNGPVRCETAPATPSSCQIHSVNFEGWNAQEISNAWIRVTIVPQLGGRVMQVKFGEHEYLFVNPKYKGKYIPPSEAQGRWFNYGGDKLWPLPEGTQDDQHWPGPVSDALDDGGYTFKVLSGAPDCRVQLQGPPDPRTGLQYSREIAVGSDSPQISFHALMKNASDHPIRWSVQSVTQYDTATAPGSAEYNHNFWAFTPANPDSSYLDGYHFRLGLSGDPFVEVRNGMFRLHWSYFEREIWIDSTAGWLAVFDGASRYAMVERFPHSADAEYPGKATVIFYTNGRALEFDKQGEPTLTAPDPLELPYYMEAEVNSPMIRLNPGETYGFDTAWLPVRVGNEPSAVTEIGVIGKPLSATRTVNGVSLSGSFGVFAPGNLTAFLLDPQGKQIGSVALGSANPLDAVELNKTVTVPAATERITLHLIDEHGRDRGAIGEAKVAGAF